jgi:hypothetical protein
MIIVFIGTARSSSPGIGPAGAAAYDDDHHRRRHILIAGDQAAIAAAGADDHSRGRSDVSA